MTPPKRKSLFFHKTAKVPDFLKQEDCFVYSLIVLWLIHTQSEAKCVEVQVHEDTVSRPKSCTKIDTDICLLKVFRIHFSMATDFYLW